MPSRDDHTGSRPMPFVEVIVDLRRGRQVLEVGAGVALVIAVLTGLLRLNGQGHGEG